MINENIPSSCAALEQAIQDYLKWMASNGYALSTQKNYQRQLSLFVTFINRSKSCCNEIFTQAQLKRFKKCTQLPNIHAVTGLSRYLFNQGKIARHLRMNDKSDHLPNIYKAYLQYQQKRHQASARSIKAISGSLSHFYHYLERHHLKVEQLRIEDIDAFMATLYQRYSFATCRVYRSNLRGFLRFLYQEHRMLHRDLSSLLVGRREYAKTKPPNFLRPEEVQKLFAGLKTDTASDIRTYAWMHLAYTMGLRHNEICQISLDDMSFSRRLLTVRQRKGNNPLELPVPEHTLKAIAAYIIAARPQSQCRTLFLTLMPPYRPVHNHTVSYHIKKMMKKAGLSSPSYSLRHTYAQNMLEAGASIFEIKEMLGHDKIESTKFYLHVHTKLMRQVLFDETL